MSQRPHWLAALVVVAAASACEGDEAAPAGDSGGEGGESGVSTEPAAAGEPTSGGTKPSFGGAGGEAGGEAPLGQAGADAGSGGDAHPPELPRRFEAYPPSPYPPENPDSDAKALLGKILFWDEQLGGDDTMACGTCHRPSAGGSDPRSALAAAALPGPDAMLGTADDAHGSPGVVRCNSQGVRTGASVQITTRKAPSYLDAMLAGRLFWDGRAECAKQGCPTYSAFEDPDQPGTFPIQTGGALENQAVGPPLSAVEMACEEASWPQIHQKLALAKPLALAKQVPSALADFVTQHQASYPKLFQAAFGDTQTSGPEDEINTRRIAFALATHERRLRSDQTPWDRWNAGDDAALTPGQLRGYQVFTGRGRCQLCHSPPVFSDNDFHFIGFHRPAWDLGRKAINTSFGVPGAMRTPTLRNVGLRARTGLLHSGAGPGASLAELVELYDKGGLVEDPEVSSVPIDATLQPLGLTPAEKADLLDFLEHALDDPRVEAQTAPFDRPTLASE
jgi:cytochrome c peroxidase